MNEKDMGLLVQASETICKFEKDLCDLINRHSLENFLDMPDYLIANLMGANLYHLIRVHLLNKEWHSPEGITSDKVLPEK